MFYIGTVLYSMLLYCLHSYLSCLYKFIQTKIAFLLEQHMLFFKCAFYIIHTLGTLPFLNNQPKRVACIFKLFLLF